jgi:hypothetical protein
VLEVSSWPCAPRRTVGSGRTGVTDLGVAGTGVILGGEVPDIATRIATVVVSIERDDTSSHSRQCVTILPRSGINQGAICRYLSEGNCSKRVGSVEEWGWWLYFFRDEVNELSKSPKPHQRLAPPGKFTFVNRVTYSSQ